MEAHPGHGPVPGGDPTLADLLRVLVGRNPRTSAKIVGFLTVAGLSDALGLASLLPLLSYVTPGVDGGDGGIVDRTVDAVFSVVGMEPTLISLLTVVVIGTALRAGFVFLATTQGGYASARFAADLRAELVDALMTARWAHFVAQPVGRLANALGHEANRAANVFFDVASLAASVVQVTVYLALAMIVAWQVSLGAVVVGGLMAFALRSLFRTSRAAGRSYTLVLRSLTAQLVDALGAIKPVRAMARETALQRRLRVEVGQLETAQRLQIRSQASLAAFQEPLTIAILAIGVAIVLPRELLPADQLLFLALLFQRSMSRVGTLQGQYQIVRAEESSLWSLLESIKLAEAAREEHEGSGATPTLRDRLEFRDVSYAHREGAVVLDGFSASVPAGRMTAIVGPSGAGKTTLVDLVVGLHHPHRGDVLLDGVPLRAVDLRAWRSMVGYVPQEPILFHDTVLANVTLGDPTVTREAVDLALDRAGASGFVAELEDGINTAVGERGTRLSGGQRQRLSMARALVNKPALLVLDEATSGLDAATESAIMDTLAELRDQMTILVISHQRDAVDRADHLITVEPSEAS